MTFKLRGVCRLGSPARVSSSTQQKGTPMVRFTAFIRNTKVQIAAYTAALFCFTVAQASAAASATTGIDYVADLVTPVKSELTLAIVAGLGLMVVLIAVRAGTKLVKSFGR